MDTSFELNAERLLKTPTLLTYRHVFCHQFKYDGRLCFHRCVSVHRKGVSHGLGSLGGGRVPPSPVTDPVQSPVPGFVQGVPTSPVTGSVPSPVPGPAWRRWGYPQPGQDSKCCCVAWGKPLKVM